MDTNYINMHFCHTYTRKVHDDMTLMSNIGVYCTLSDRPLAILADRITVDILIY